MQLRSTLIVAVLLATLTACGGNTIQLPIDTSLGRLVRIDKKESVATDERTVSAAAGKILYLLSFEGKSEISYEGDEKNALHAVSLVDGKGTEFNYVFAGSPNNEGTLSKKEWRYNGQLNAKDGQWIFQGVLSVPPAKMVLAYEVPKDSSDLSLKNGEQKHAID